jgi:hypothetical protein
MRHVECLREREVQTVTRLVGWRESCDEELKRHIDQCDICADVVAVVELMREDYEHATERQLPGAAQVWWRAAVRARADARQAAVRPLTWVHGIAAACAVGVGAAAIGFAWPTIAPLFESLGAFVGRVDPNGTVISAIVQAAQTRLPLVLTIAAFVIAAPVALYFALSEDD